MLLPLLLLQINISIAPGGGTGDSAAQAHAAEWRARHRIPVTAATLADAYRDPIARELINRARVVRAGSDTSLVAYDATTYQRMSLGMAFKQLARSRLFLREESATRVRWRRGVGAAVEMRGARAAMPMLSAKDNQEEMQDVMNDGDFTPIPYTGDQDEIILGTRRGKGDVDPASIINPLGNGGEAYYRYASGDSVTITGPDGTRLRLREIRVEPRWPQWNLLVGSLWFDADRAQVIRTVFRLSEPFDLFKVAAESADSEMKADLDSIPRAAKALIMPIQFSIDEIITEYELVEGRWWLPHLQQFNGKARVSIMHVPFTMQSRFSYASVNGTDPLPSFSEADTLNLPPRPKGKVPMDSIEKIDSLRHAIRKQARDAECAQNGTYHIVTHRGELAIPVRTEIPCDTAKLTHSAELPPSLYDDNEPLFNSSDLSEMEKALGMGMQPGWSPQKPVIFYGFTHDLLRYNRVEGLSAGLGVSESFGNGFTGEAFAQLGTADLDPKGELTLRRDNGRVSYAISGYRRLAVVDDWGTPLAAGHSLNALFFGRDEAFYYRSMGGEIAGSIGTISPVTWRVFGEHETDVNRNTQFSLAHTINDNNLFLENIQAAPANEFGVALRWSPSWGQNPRGWRLLDDIRLEGAQGDFDYTRGAMDATISHALGGRLLGAVTLGGGSSTGVLPPQRLWYLGGTYTVRGETDGAAVGNAYWMGHGEVALDAPIGRPTVFADFGWAGDRRNFSKVGRPLSGVGAGYSIMDGMIRFDVARGLYPKEQWRTDLYLEARF